MKAIIVLSNKSKLQIIGGKAQLPVIYDCVEKYGIFKGDFSFFKRL